MDVVRAGCGSGGDGCSSKYCLLESGNLGEARALELGLPRVADVEGSRQGEHGPSADAAPLRARRGGAAPSRVVDSALRIEREKGISAGRAWGKAVGGAVGSVLLACYLIVAATLTTALLLLHVYLVSTGRTTAEFFKGTFRGVTNPHDRGCLANWRALLLPRASNWCSLPPTGMASPPPSPGSEVQLTA